MRLAIFSPLPPVASGIADYTIDLAAALAPRHDVHLFAGTPDEVAANQARAGVTVAGAHDFPWQQHREPFDLILYQMGNARCHDFMWAYLFTYPGLVVLHDAKLHHARAWSLLRRRRTAEYRTELAFNQPDLPARAAEPALAGFAGLLYYLWPMRRATLLAARAVAVHNERLAEELTADVPDIVVRSLRMGVPPAVASPEEARAIRARHGLAPDASVVAAFGGITREKRLGALFRAAAVARRVQPGLRLLIVGGTSADYDASAEAMTAGVGDILTLTGRIPDGEIGAYLNAADIVSCLRWPSAGETSASWLRALAAGRPTIVTALAQQVDVPVLDPRDWVTYCGRPGVPPAPAVAVAIDPLDENHSLVLALKRLVTEPTLREALGSRARQYWAAHHSIDRMCADYEAVMDEAARRSSPAVALPAHLRPDGLAGARETLAPFGLTPETVFGTATPGD